MWGAGWSGRWLALAAVVVALPFLGKAPAIDEEGYLWIASQLSWLRPYDWTRVWPPYDGTAYAWAHPPLHLYWLSLWSSLTTNLLALRVVVGLPLIALLACSVHRLAARVCHHPEHAAALWLASPIVVLGLHDSLLIDLPAVALATFGMAAYREGLVDEDQRWFVASGIALGLAIETKYSVAVLVPVLLLHMTRLGPRPWLWAGLVGVVAAVEGPLWLVYGVPHPWEVWVRRVDIAAGGFAGRLEGTLARAALLAFPLVFVRSDPRLLAAGLAVAIPVVLAARPAELPVAHAAALLAMTALGLSVCARATMAVLSPATRRRKGDRGDPLLLGGWFLAVVAGVVVFHNYASARYLLLAAAPAALMLARSGEEVPWGKVLLRIAAGVGAVTALVLAVADYRFAAAGIEVARAVVALEAPMADPTGAALVRRFAGEWSFRGELEAAGWARYRLDEVLPAGGLVAVAANASAGEVALELLEPLRVVESADRFPVRVVDIGQGIGLYAETLGPLPFGIGRGPLESAVVYRVRGE